MSDKQVAKKIVGEYYVTGTSHPQAEDAGGVAVYKRGDVTHYTDGSQSMGMNFPVLVAVDYIEDPHSFLEHVADALNAKEGLVAVGQFSC